MKCEYPKNVYYEVFGITDESKYEIMRKRIDEFSSTDNLNLALLHIRGRHHNNLERNMNIVQSYFKDGKTHKQIAEIYGLSPQRIRDIITDSIRDLRRYPASAILFGGDRSYTSIYDLDRLDRNICRSLENEGIITINDLTSLSKNDLKRIDGINDDEILQIRLALGQCYRGLYNSEGLDGRHYPHEDNANILCLNIDRAIIGILRDSGINKISDLVKLSRAVLSTIPNMSDDYIRSIEDALSAEHRSLNNYSSNYIVLNVETCLQTSDSIDALSIKKNQRIYMALMRNNISSISHLLEYTYEDLIKLDGIGCKTADEILESLIPYERFRHNGGENKPKDRNSINGRKFRVPMPLRTNKTAYYCLNCGNFGFVELALPVSNNLPRVTGSFAKPIYISEVCVRNYVRCVDCNEYMVDLDYDIADKIKKLNDIGVKTIYCCQGHIDTEYLIDPAYSSHIGDERHASCPYIEFYANKHDNEDLINIAYDLVSKYDHLKIAFMNPDHEESDGYSRICIYGEINNITEDELSIVQKEFMDFLDDLITQYEMIDR